MSSLYICGRCARRIAIYQGNFFRSYSSLGRVEANYESVAVPNRGRRHFSPAADADNQDDENCRTRLTHQHHGIRRSSDDKALETLFSSNLKSGEQPTRSRYSRTPISQQGSETNEPQKVDDPAFKHISTSNLASSPVLESPHQGSENVVQQPPIAPRLEAAELSETHDDETLPQSLNRFSMRRHSGTRHNNTFSDKRKSRTEEKDWISTLTEEIDKAVTDSNARHAVQVWMKTQRYLDQKRRGRDPAKLDILFTKFLSAFFGLRRAETAIAVWNYMVQGGHEVNKTHWTAMLHGCIKGRDASSLKEIWENMNSSADTAAWTTYICGLIKCRRWEEGIDALNQLGRIWKSKPNIKSRRRHKGTSPEAVMAENKLSPSLGPVKAAIDALIDIEKDDLVEPVLGWASSHGLQPDTHTYNILLRPVARTGNLVAIKAHLAQMSSNTCQPDITTFTIILSSLVSSPESNFHSLTPEEQESTILSLLDDMRAANVPPNAYTYSTILSALLKPPFPPSSDPNSPHITVPSTPSTTATTTTTTSSLAHNLLAHMHANAIPPTPHIYTILFTHLFSTPTPDLPAIHTLWQSIQPSSSPGGPTAATTTTINLDPIFYDRMIIGLANAGQAEDSLKFVQRMARDGKTLSWVALGRCLDVLSRVGGAEGREGARWLVGEVERDGGLMRWGEREVRGKGAWGRRVEELRREGWFEVGEEGEKEDEVVVGD